MYSELSTCGEVHVLHWLIAIPEQVKHLYGISDINNIIYN